MDSPLPLSWRRRDFKSRSSKPKLSLVVRPAHCLSLSLASVVTSAPPCTPWQRVLHFSTRSPWQTTDWNGSTAKHLWLIHSMTAPLSYSHPVSALLRPNSVSTAHPGATLYSRSSITGASSQKMVLALWFASRVTHFSWRASAWLPSNRHRRSSAPTSRPTVPERSLPRSPLTPSSAPP